VTAKDFYIITKTLSNKSFAFELSISRNCKQHINILEWFLKDVKLKIGVLEIQLYHHRN